MGAKNMKRRQILFMVLLFIFNFQFFIGTNYNHVLIACSSEENYNIQDMDEFHLNYALGGTGRFINITQDEGETVQTIDLTNETFYDNSYSENQSEMDELYHNNIEEKPHLFLNFRRESNLIYNCSIELALLNYTFKGSVLYNLESYCFIFEINNKSTDIKIPFLVSPSIISNENFEFLTYDATTTPQVMVYSDFPSTGIISDNILFHPLLQKNVQKFLIGYEKQDAYLSGLATESRELTYERKSFFLISGFSAFMGNAYASMIKAAIPEIVYLPDWTSTSFYIVDTNLPTSQESSTNGDNLIGIIITILIFTITPGVITVIWKRNKNKILNEKKIKRKKNIRKSKNRRI